MAEIGQKFGLTGSSINYDSPTELYRLELPTGAIVNNAGGTAVFINSTAAFTSLNGQGLADTTNWSTDTYKSLLSTSEAGEMIAYIGPELATSGGIHTVEFTVDGVVTTIAVTTTANNSRPMLTTNPGSNSAAFTTASNWYDMTLNTLTANKRTFGSYAQEINGWQQAAFFHVPALAWKNSFQVRAKNSAAITNSTATAYSAILYRLKGTT